VKPYPLPQRAFLVTWSAEEGVARIDVARVEGKVLDRTVDVNTPEHVPNFALQPVPQYAVVEPQ
jgi:hypothetical protein